MRKKVIKFWPIVFTGMILAGFLTSCKDSSLLGPEQMPGSRSYAWTLDTIFTPKDGTLYLSRIWGSDAENVWAIGFGNSYRKQLWHYDGKKWTPDTNTIIFNPWAIYGFGRNNIWVGNGSGEFWRCTDSKNWSKFSKPKLPGYPNVCITGMWGAKDDEILAVGYAEDSARTKYKMLIEVFNGKTWMAMPTPDISVGLVYVRKQISSGMFILGGVVDDRMLGDIYKIYSYDGKNVKELYSGKEAATVNDMNGEVYVGIGRNIYKYKDGQLVEWKHFTSTIYYAMIWGRNESDFFFNSFQKGRFGLGHYNGMDMETLFIPEQNLSTFDAVIFENDVFFLSHDDHNTDNSIIIHGKKSIEK